MRGSHRGLPATPLSIIHHPSSSSRPSAAIHSQPGLPFAGSTPGPLAAGENQNSHMPISQATDRINQLSSRLSTLQSGIETRKSRQVEALEAQLVEIEERLSEAESYRDEELKIIKEYLARLSEAVDSEHRYLEAINEAKNGELEQVRDSIRYTLAEIASERREGEDAFEHAVAEQMVDLATDLRKVSEERREAHDRRAAALGADLPRVRSALEADLVEADNGIEHLQNRTRTMLTALKQAILVEEQQRKQAEQQFRGLVEDIGAKVQAALTRETREREEGEEQLVKLLEQTTSNYLSINDVV